LFTNVIAGYLHAAIERSKSHRAVMASDPKRTHAVFWLLLWVALVWIATIGWSLALMWAANAVVDWLLIIDAARHG
jgi:uncharacterized membrane protein